MAVLPVHVDDAVAEQLVERAQREDRSVSWLLRRLLRDALAAEKIGGSGV